VEALMDDNTRSFRSLVTLSQPCIWLKVFKQPYIWTNFASQLPKLLTQLRLDSVITLRKSTYNT